MDGEDSIDIIQRCWQGTSCLFTVSQKWSMPQCHSAEERQAEDEHLLLMVQPYDSCSDCTSSSMTQRQQTILSHVLTDCFGQRYAVADYNRREPLQLSMGARNRMFMIYTGKTVE